MTPSPSAGLTVDRVREIRENIMEVCRDKHDVIPIAALCDAWLATHKPANVCPSCGGDMNAAPLPGCNRLGFDEDEV